MKLAVATGVAPGVWIAEGERVMQTACLVLDEQAKETKKGGRRGSGGTSGPQMSG